MKKLGVIGGLGPMATAYFLQLLTQMSDAATDQGHMEILLHSKPQIPDRTRFILGLSRESPLPQMARIGIDLRSQGADLIAIPCITAHYFQRSLEAVIGIPVLNAIEETAVCLKEAGISRAGVLATDGTIKSGLFQQSFRAAGVECLLPDRKSQQAVMDMIYGKIKAGKPADMSIFQGVSADLMEAGAEVVLLACSELSLVKRDPGTGVEFLDVMEVLARKAVLCCGRLKGEYRCLVKHRQGILEEGAFGAGNRETGRAGRPAGTGRPVGTGRPETTGRPGRDKERICRTMC